MQSVLLAVMLHLSQEFYFAVTILILLKKLGFLNFLDNFSSKILKFSKFIKYYLNWCFRFLKDMNRIVKDVDHPA